MDCVTKYKMYVDRAKELGMEAIAFTEHGNMFEWIHKKEYIERAGLKYIHGVEAYITLSLVEKVRDNFHVILLAKNYDGVKELNYIMSDKHANNRDDGHFYYAPRITYEELKSLSDNIIITTSCLGGILNSGNLELEKDFIGFLSKNKDRCFLEIQHHQVEDQIEYNKKLLGISEKTGIRLVAGTDTHSLNEDYAEGRIILQRAKNIFFENEEGWDLTFKTYEELVSAYEKQNSIPESHYLQAIENTNLIADMVEDFDLDRSHKYPKLYENSEQVFKDKIYEGIKSREAELTEEVKSRVQHELDTIRDNGAIDYLLLEEDYKSWCRKNDIPYGFGRGSVSGSYIAYLLKITEMDSIEHNLIFERFMNKERVSLCDVDTDLPPSKRDLVKDYIYSKDGLYCADIITFNTIALKGAIRDVGRALDMPLDEVDMISKSVDRDEAKLRDKYPKLFKFVDLLNGVIVSVGTHPAGLVVSPFPIEGIMGTCTLSTTNYPVTQINMKEIDGLNFVKLDLLGLDNVEIIDETCKLAGIENITPSSIDDSDVAVWNSIRDSALGVFQWESSSAWSYYRRLFSDATIEKIKVNNPNFNYMDLFSMGNGAIRPAGESYREALANGEFQDNGHEALNELLSPTMGFLVFQEQIIEFLNKFCGFSMGEADMVRRGFSKKSGTEQYVPKIKEGFVDTMSKNYGTCKEEAEEIIINFIQVIEDASDYLFSINHSQSYSYIGYTCAWLRHYYPLEFLTSLLNVSEDNQDKTTKAFDYISQFTDIKVSPIKFRGSKGEYTMNKGENTIYKGISSIKYLSENLADELYELRANKYDTFLDLLIDIKKETSCNSRQLDILIKLDFFSEFGGAKKLLKIAEMQEFIDKNRMSIAKIDETPFSEEQFNRYSGRKAPKTYMEIDFISMIRETINDIPNEGLTILEKAEAEKENLGYVDLSLGLDGKKCYVSNVDTKFTPRVDLISLGEGKPITAKIRKEYFAQLNLEEGDLIYVHRVERRQAWKKVGEKKNGKPDFAKIEGKFDLYINSCEKLSEKQLYEDMEIN